MITVTVRYFAKIREITGKRDEMLRIEDDTTVETLLQALSNKYGKEFSQYVFDEKTQAPRAHLQLLIDGKSTVALQGNKTRITDRCVFTIIPSVAGG